jgi:hypothetical protein
MLYPTFQKILIFNIIVRKDKNVLQEDQKLRKMQDVLKFLCLKRCCFERV